MSCLKATFVYSVLTFVRKDIKILNKMNVSLIKLDLLQKRFFNFTNRFKNFKSILFIPKSQIVICWFCDYHKLIPLLYQEYLRKICCNS